MEEATLCDRVAILDHGKLLTLDSPPSLIARHHAKNLEEVFLTVTGHGLRDEEVSESEMMRTTVRRLRRWR